MVRASERARERERKREREREEAEGQEEWREKGFRRAASKTIFNARGIENAAYAAHVPTGARKTYFVC